MLLAIPPFLEGQEHRLIDEREAAARDVAERFWEGYLRLEPTMGTAIGDERYDDRMPDPSREGQQEKRDFLAGIKSDLERVDRDGLTVDIRTTLDLVEAATRREIDRIDLHVERLHAVSHIFGPGNLLADLATMQRADTPERADKYLARLGAVPDFLDAVSGLAEAGVEEKMTAPVLVVDRTIGQVGRLLRIAPKESPGIVPVPPDHVEDRERVAKVLREGVYPAFERYAEELRRYRRSAREDIGLLGLPNGDAIYATLIFGHTTLPLEPRRIHDTGQEELAKIQQERREIAGRLGHPDAETAIAEFTASGKNTAGSREEMLAIILGQVERSWEAAPRFFGRLPRANCGVKPVEEFREDDMPGAFYFPPTADGSRRGVYYVNTGQLQGRPLHATATTSFHEANPGHHFQLSIDMEFTDRLPARRFGGFLVGDSFVEGWGLYSERLADEMGLFLNEYERLGMLEADAFRAARLIVDTGIHALGWDRERAVKQLQSTGASRVDSEIEVDRYIAMPGQACAYKIGELEILRWRKEATDRDGSAFSLMEFHDRLLALGSLPLRAIERELRTTVPTVSGGGAPLER